MSIKGTAIKLAPITVFLAIILLVAFLFIIPKIKEANFSGFLKEVQEGYELNSSTISVMARYEGYEKNLVDFNGNKKIHPGSNFKLFTAAASLNYLGPNFTFKTKLYEFDDQGKNSILLVGGGDPSFQQKSFEQFIEKLKVGPKITGDLYYDDTYFEGEKFGPDWSMNWKDEYFAVPITGLQINNNLLEIRGGEIASTGKFGIETWPIENYGKILDLMTYYQSGEDLNVPLTASTDDSGVIIIRGDTLKDLPFKTSTTVKDPSLMTALVLKQELLKADLINDDVKVLKYNEEIDPSKLNLIYEHSSPKLSELVLQMLKFSKNNYAETMVRTLGREVGDDGTQAAGVEILYDFFDEIGIDPYEIVAFDGSGLSPSTRATSNSFLVLFDYVNEQIWRDVFWNSLPESEKDGTLKHRFEEAGLKHQVIGKTGTHEFASSLSGKILRPESMDIIFSVHIYNHPYSTEDSVANVRPLIDQIVALIDKQF